MKLKVVACGVFEPEIVPLVEKSRNQIHLVLLDAGLHAEPAKLRTQVQDHIDSAAAAYDAVVVVYGLCGRGTAGLVAREIPVVLPRVHDCVSLFLGSAGEYRRQFARHPGTFYITPGWYKHKIDPAARVQRWHYDNVREHPRFAELAARYGADNAAHILLFHDSWKGNYTRAAYLDTLGEQDTAAEQHARLMAEAFGWQFERIAGRTDLLYRMLEGEWNDEEVLVLQPGQRSTITGDERIFSAIDLGHDRQPNGLRVVTNQKNNNAIKKAHSPVPAALGIGIDVGGTYTDCVLYDFNTRRVLSKAKALSTPHDLMEGINEALSRLELPQPENVRLVALSTTLATNAIVEGKGGRPGLILTSAVRAGLDQISWRPRRVVPGAMAIDGYEIAPIDEQATRQAVRQLLDEKVDAFAISGYASTKNPAHELAIKKIVSEMCDLPVVCGHELSVRLNYVERANSAVLNARLLPLIKELLQAAGESLRQRGIDATLMVVKGDGTLISEQVACQRPVETILSGPAASVNGAQVLTGQKQAVVVDIGGTTTDTAMLENGTIRISERGASVAGWRTAVDAAKLTTIGLGGDSHLDFTADRKLVLGPRRVLPLSLLCARWPAAKEALMQMRPEQIPHRSSAAWLDFFVLARQPRRVLTGQQRRIVELLSEKPLSRETLANRLELISPLLLHLQELEDEGIVVRSALTPTDLLHCEGKFTAWDVEAAAKGLEIFADLYGAPAAQIRAEAERLMVRLLSVQVLRAVVNGKGDLWESTSCEGCRILLDSIFDAQPSHGVEVTLSCKWPIVAMGAPAWAFFPQVGHYLNTRIIIPEHAEVANAVGAVAGDVVVREKAVIRPGENANYVLHWREGRMEFEHLEQAVEAAKRYTAGVARQRALQAGTDCQDITYDISDRSVRSADGAPVLVEMVVEATIKGHPALRPAPVAV